MDDLKQFIIEKDVYDRMIEMMNEDDLMWDSYEEFYEWNMGCLDEAPAHDVTWLTGLCKRMASSKIKLMDEESCVRMPAYAFYFDDKKNIVIVNPR